LMTDADEEIPLRHRSLWLYLSFVPYCLIVSSDLGGPRQLARIFSCVSINSLIAYRSFLRFPSSYPRPATGPVSDPRVNRAFQALHSVDRPSNTFPSIHVSHTVLLALMLSQHVPPARAHAYLTWACAISISTLLTKQHYIIDVTGGLLVAEAISRDVYEPWVEGRLSRREALRCLRRLCEQLDDLVQSRRSLPLPLRERHPRVRQWLEDYCAAGGFAELYLRSDGRKALLERKTEIEQLLHWLRKPLALANWIMPGWLQFIQDFQAAAPHLTDETVYAYLRDLDEDLGRLLPSIVELPAPEHQSAIEGVRRSDIRQIGAAVARVGA
jgi:hypothetical protein